MTTAQALTADEFYQRYADKGVEIWYGEERPVVPVGIQHAGESGDLIFLLQQFTRVHGLGLVGPELGFRLAPDLLFAPDVAFVETVRLPARAQRRAFFEGHPALAVEVVSPHDTFTEVARKVAAYLAHGTPRVWVVDPDLRTVTVHRPGRDPHTLTVGGTLTSDDAGFAVDGFVLALSDLFPSEGEPRG